MEQYQPDFDHVGYLHDLIRPERLKLTLSKAQIALDRMGLLWGPEAFDAIAVRGVSGLLVGPPLAMMLISAISQAQKACDHIRATKFEEFTKETA